MSDSPDQAELLRRAGDTIADLRARLAAAEAAATVAREPIAIVGMGCRLPGGVSSPDDLWALLESGADARVEIPDERWPHDDVYDEDPETPGRIYTRFAHLIDGVDRFDAAFFGISPREAAVMDPQQRLLLECAWEALERAGVRPDGLAGSPTGVFVGNCFHDYEGREIRLASPTDVDVYSATGKSPAVLSGRVSYLLGLTGPSLTTDTACSSSLMAAHLACASLRRGECDLAIVGGANLIVDPSAMLSLSRARMLAPDGRSKAFDASANGYGRGEGVVAMVFKRLRDAQADGDHILATVLGSATNQDGASPGLAVPSGEAQEAVIRMALADAGVHPSDIGYVEAHGTGTPVGDPIEAGAIGRAFADAGPDHRILMGSVKTNIGHLEGAAGIAGLAKVVLALERATIPAHRNLEELNPDIPWDELPVDIPTAARPWPTTERRMAGINSFGFSGSNVHMIVGDAPGAAVSADSGRREGADVIVLSAKTSSGLDAVATTLADHLAATADDLGPIARATRGRRTSFRERLAVVADSPADGAAKLRAWLDAGHGAGVVQGTSRPDLPVAFLFTGQGSQYVGMGKSVYDTEPVFRDALDTCAAFFDELLDVPLLEVMFGGGSSRGAEIDRTEYTQPALFSLEWSLAALWRSWGVEPSVVLGHSIGEYAAACLAGVFSLEDAIRLVAARGRLMGALPVGGAMAAIQSPLDDVVARIADRTGRVSIAAVNGPMAIVVSGDAEGVEAVVADCERDGLRVQRLTVSHAFHSPLMDPMLDEFREIASGVTYRPPARWLIANLTGTWAGDEVTTPDYWVDHVREAVRFHDGMQKVHELGPHAFVEIGPQPVLLGMARTAPAPPNAAWVPSLRRADDRGTALLEAVAGLHTVGVDLDWTSFDRGERTWADLPTFPFTAQRHWLELSPERAEFARAWPAPMLGPALSTALVDGVIHQTPVSVDDPAHLAGHRILDVPLFPAAGFIEMALEAIAQDDNTVPQAIERFSVRQALPLPESGIVPVQLIVDRAHDGSTELSVHGRVDGSAWVKHFDAVAAVEASPPREREDLAGLRDRLGEGLDGDAFYDEIAEIGYAYRPPYRAIGQIWAVDDEILARVALSGEEAVLAKQHRLHPALIDAMLQPVALLARRAADAEGDEVILPVYGDEVALRRPGAAAGWAHLRIRDWQPEIVRADVDLLDDDGEPIMEIRGLVGRRTNRTTLRKLLGATYDSWMYEVDWSPAAADPGAADRSRRVIVVGDDPTTIEAIVSELSPDRPVEVAGDALDDADEAAAWVRDVVMGGPAADIVCAWGDRGSTAPPSQRLSETAGRFLHLARALVSEARSLLRSDDAPRVVVTTRAAHSASGPEAESPDAAALWGLGRTVLSEHPELDLRLVDVDAHGDLASTVAAELDDEGREAQIAWRGGNRLAARLVPAARSRLELPESEEYRLTFSDRGTLENLVLEPLEVPTLGADDVLIEVRAGGVNFRDVLNVLGMYPGDPGDIGLECAGRIVAVGESVDAWKVGDDVVTLAEGAFCSHLAVRADRVHRKPTNLTYAEAATIPVTFLTAYYGLHELAKMEASDRVLIHAASGGVGIAATQLAKLAGAEVFGTAGAPWKKDLVVSMGADHVHHSRSLDFAAEIAEITGGAGVDIVLNSLADDFIPTSLGCLADGGRFLEIGKRGIWTDEQVRDLNPTLSYWPFDLLDVVEQQPDLIGSMMNALVAAFEAGDLQPLPIQGFPIQEAEAAFRFMSQARHAGKIVLTTERSAVDPEGIHLVTGGSGGLGRQVIRWLAEQGARHIVTTSRRGPTAEIDALAEDLAATGVTLEAIAADVTRGADVDSLFASFPPGRPLRSIFHAAGVLDDGAIANMDWRRFETVLAPKADAGELLHDRSRLEPVDRFVLFSSISGIIGNAGQANYAAANTWLDGLASVRRRNGLPATSINWGPWADVGMAAETPAELLAAVGLKMMDPREATAAMQAAIATGATPIGLAHLDLERLASVAGDDPFYERLAAVASARGAAGGRSPARGSGEMVGVLAAAPVAERRGVLLDFVCAQIARVLGMDDAQSIDTQLGLFDLGMDSLTAVEFGNLLEGAFAQPFPPTLAFEAPTIEHLADLVLAEIALDEAPGSESADVPTPDDERRAAIAGDVAALTEEEAFQSLVAEIGSDGPEEGAPDAPL